jgi:hypothetical protein
LTDEESSMRYFLGAAVGLMMATSAYATDPCDHYVVVGGFKSHQAALGRARLVPGSKVTYGNQVVPVFSPGWWHVYVGSFQTFDEADRALPRYRRLVPDAFVKHDCTDAGVD